MTIEEIEIEKAETGLREVFSHGHPDFITKCIQETALHSNKNHDYAVGGDPCGNFLRSVYAKIIDILDNEALITERNLSVRLKDSPKLNEEAKP